MNSYDIFISYRRKGGFETAKHLFDLLRYDGYSVSFDIDTLREGRFDKELFNRIAQCTDFILVVDAHAFDRTIDPEFKPEYDWLRQELSYALKYRKNIIPILLPGASFPNVLPEDVDDVRYINGPEYSTGYFDSFYKKMLSFLQSKPNISNTINIESKVVEKSMSNNEETDHVQCKDDTIENDAFESIQNVIGRLKRRITITIAEFKDKLLRHNANIKIVSIVSITILSLILSLSLFVFSPRMKTARHRLFSNVTDNSKVVSPYMRPPHGRILADDGSVIARDYDCYDFYLSPQMDYNRDTERNIRILSRQLALVNPRTTASQLYTSILNTLRLDCDINPVIAQNFTKEEVLSLKNECYKIENGYKNDIVLNLQDGTHIGFFKHRINREYPYGRLARRAIGYVKYLDKVLYIGLEGKYDTRLTYSAEEEREDMLSTLQMDIQALADSVLRSRMDSTVKGACVMLMDVKTGAIRAMVNLHQSKDGTFGENYNYSIAHNYEPGSVASTMSLAVALEDNLYNSLEHTIPTNGGMISPTLPIDFSIAKYEQVANTKEISIIDGFKLSSRYVMSYLLNDCFNEPEYFMNSMKDLTLSSYVDDFDIEGFRDVDFPDVNAKYFDENTLPSIASGFAWTLTPLHLLAFYNMVANGGTMLMPFLVHGFVKGNKFEANELTPVNNRIRPKTASAITRALVANCDDDKVLAGTKCKIAGKSGISKQIIDRNLRNDVFGDPYLGNHNTHEFSSTFAGFFPADKPQYSIVCAVFTNLTTDFPESLTVPKLVVQEIVNALDYE